MPFINVCERMGLAGQNNERSPHGEVGGRGERDNNSFCLKN